MNPGQGIDLLKSVSALWRLRYFGVLVYLAETLSGALAKGQITGGQYAICLTVAFCVLCFSGAWQAGRGQPDPKGPVTPLPAPVPLPSGDRPGLDPEDRQILDKLRDLHRKTGPGPLA